MMRINADYAERVVIDTNTRDWVPTPWIGVYRMMLDRIGDEVALATTIVRYARNSNVEAHTHDKGEEFFVLEGVFEDEHGSYPAGTYVRNPPGSHHTPKSEGGCKIFVKLRHFAEDDGRRIVIDTKAGEWQQREERPGLSTLPLHEHRAERVYLVRFEAGAKVDDDPHPGGEEVLVLEGVLKDEHGTYPAGTWLRQPDGSRHAPHSEGGCLLWVKRGHLDGANIDAP